MENKSRKLMLCGTTYQFQGKCVQFRTPPYCPFPYVLVKGRWFADWGFAVGDQVTLSNPEPGTLVMKVTKTSHEFARERKINRKEQDILRMEQKHRAA